MSRVQNLSLQVTPILIKYSMCWASLIKGDLITHVRGSVKKFIKLLNSQFPISLSFWENWFNIAWQPMALIVYQTIAHFEKKKNEYASKWSREWKEKKKHKYN